MAADGSVSRRFVVYGGIASLSGFSALVFENLWFRSSALALGSGVWSSALVLSAFMAGIALGNALAIRFDTSVERPLRAYAAVEFTIALSGLAALLMLPKLTGFLAPAFRGLDTVWAINLVRFGSAFLVLIVPAAGMGATFPLLMKAIGGEPEAFGKWLGIIYGANTGGAVLGALGCDLVLVPAVGVYGAGLAAASLNALAGVLALRGDGRWAPALPQRKNRTAPAARIWPAWPLAAAAFCCGVVFLAFEAVFFRFQLLFFTSLTTTFAVMLAVVLAGIAAGGFGAAWLLARRRNALAWLPLLSFGTGVTLLVSYRWFPGVAKPAVQMSPGWGALVTTFELAFPVAFLSGMMFTLIGNAIHSAGHSAARATASVTIANTIGSAVGSMMAGLYLIPTLGLETCFRVLILAYIGIGVWLAIAMGRKAVARTLWPLWATAAFLMTIAAFPGGMMAAVYQLFPVSMLMSAGEQRVAVKEGQLETLQYLRSDVVGRPNYYRLVVNNHSMSASEVRSRRYMSLLAYMPRLLHPAPRKAALIGLGLGVTAQGLTDDDRLDQIDVVDISRDVASMLGLLYPAPHTSPLEDVRVRLHVEDGRFFLQTSTDGYDIITGEPPPPHYAGVAGLYSREFFELVRRRLNPGGIVTYWLPVHDLKVAEAQSITSAFLDVFPNASLWAGAGFEWILMAVKSPAGQQMSAQLAEWDRAPLAGPLRQIGVETPESLGALFLGDGDRLRAWARGAPALTDNFPRRTSLGVRRDDEDTKAFLAMLNAPEAARNFASSRSVGAFWPADMRARTDAAAFERQARLNTMLSLPSVTVSQLQALIGEGPPDPLLVKALFWRHAFDVDRVRTILQAEPQLTGDDVAEYQAALEMMAGRFASAAEFLERVSADRAARVMTIRLYCRVRAEKTPTSR